MTQRGPEGWLAPRGFAGIPTTAIDPPHRAASPAVPAIMGPGPHRPPSAMRNQAAVVLASTSFWNSRRISE